MFRDDSRALDRFSLLLALTAVSVVALSLVDLGDPGAGIGSEIAVLVSSVLVAVTLSVALRTSGLARRWQRGVDVLLAVAVIGLGLVVLVDVVAGRPVVGIDTSTPSVVLVVLAVLAPVVVVRRLLHHHRITRATLFAALSAYLLIAVAYFYAFLAVDSYGPSFFGEDEPTTSFMYFSLTSITTVGYGDLSAATPPGRLLAASEAVLGQVYLVTVVAFTVSLLGEQRRRDQPQD